MTRHSNLTTSSQPRPSFCATISIRTRERASYTLSAMRTRKRSQRTVQRMSSVTSLSVVERVVVTPGIAVVVSENTLAVVWKGLDFVSDWG